MEPIVLPALRGVFGDWVYYSTHMSLHDLAQRVSYARTVHRSRKLSDYIQRSLEDRRQVEIAEYLTRNEQRFFSSLVVAVYGGEPRWYQAEHFQPESEEVDLKEIPQGCELGIGFLRLIGTEKLFALDGQHRLAGAKLAVEQNTASPDDEVPVLLVAHENTSPGLQRTRRLFVTLNKTAVAVPKRDIIALDEDDVAAICTRWLVESQPWFRGERIAYNATSNLQPDDRKTFTSIVALYDALMVLFRAYPRAAKSKQLRFNRPKEEVLDQYRQSVGDVFKSLAANCDSYRRFVKAKDFERVVRQMRGPHGGHILFRPVGLNMFMRLIATVSKHAALDHAVAEVMRLPQQLSEEPYRSILWHPRRKAMIPDGKGLCLRLLRYMLGDREGVDKLRKDYAASLERDPSDIALLKPVSDVLSGRGQ